MFRLIIGNYRPVAWSTRNKLSCARREAVYKYFSSCILVNRISVSFILSLSPFYWCPPVATQGWGPHVPRLERAVLRQTKWAEINFVNSKNKLLMSSENNYDIDIFINTKYAIKSPIYWF